VTFQLDESEASYALQLHGEAGIEDAIELKEYLLHGLRSGRALRVNLEKVTRVDVTALQLLWAAKHEASLADTMFSIDGKISADVSAAFNEAGLENILMEAK
jgi:anti-anti-sigma regulatory factor